jgi:hypothetical protein
MGESLSAYRDADVRVRRADNAAPRRPDTPPSRHVPQVKMIMTLEGCPVITPDPADVQALHELRHLGIDADTDARHATSGSSTSSARATAVTWDRFQPRSAWRSSR